MNFLNHIDWLEPNQKLNMTHYDHARMNFIEAPTFITEEALIKIKGISNLFIGRNTGVGETSILYSNTIIGRYCSIAQLVQIGGMGHRMDHLSTGYLDETKTDEFTHAIMAQYKRFTQLGCDVWVGGGAILFRDVQIGHGACIGAGSVVTTDIPPYAVAAGIPAKIIKYRFSEKIIEDLLSLKWWTLEPMVVKNLPYQNVEQSIEILKQIRKSSMSS